jgi:tetratricopeptide (TPR) repeat protein
MVARSLAARVGTPSGRVPWWAVSIVARLLVAVTGSARWRFRLGRAREQLGDLAGARQAYERATDASGAPPEWGLSLARVLEVDHRWDDAAERYRTYLAAVPEKAEVRERLADVLERAGERDASAAELRRYLDATRPTDAELFDLGARFERCGDLDGALSAYRRLDRGRGAGSSTKLDVRVVRTLRRRGELEAAEERVRDALAVAPDHVGLRREHAELATSERRWDDAVERWTRVVELSGDASAYAKLLHAQRSAGDLDAAWATVGRARERHPHDLRVIAEDARVSAARYGEVAEDLRHGWKERLVVLERLLAARETEVLEVPAQARALGNLRLALRDWDGAIGTWEAVEGRFPEVRDEARIKQARAHRSAGREVFARAALPIDDPARLERSRAEEHLVLAARALDRVSEAGERSEPYGNEADRLATQYGRWASSHAAAVAQLHLRAGRTGEATRVLEGALALRGYPDVRPLAPILHGLSELAAAGHGSHGPAATSPPASPGARLEAAPDGPTTVLVSGFLYSGSGAAYDYLRQYPTAAEPFGSHELWVLKKLNNFGRLLDSGSVSVGQFTDAAIASVLTNVFGFGQMGFPISVYFEEAPRSPADLSELVAPFVAELTDAVRCAAAGSAPVAPDRAREAVRWLLSSLVGQLTPPGEVAVLNNAVPAFQLRDHMDLFPRARAVVVLRDPRDQYVSQRLESPYSRGCEEFVAMMEDRYDAFAAALSAPTGEHVLPVRFERFVSDAGLREEVARTVGLGSGGPAADEDSFDAARSQRNVGIHAAYEHPAEVRYVEERLTPVLDALLERTVAHRADVTA